MTSPQITESSVHVLLDDGGFEILTNKETTIGLVRVWNGPILWRSQRLCTLPLYWECLTTRNNVLLLTALEWPKYFAHFCGQSQSPFCLYITRPRAIYDGGGGRSLMGFILSSFLKLYVWINRSIFWQQQT